MAKNSSWKRKPERLTLTLACVISFALLAVHADATAGPWSQVATTGSPSPRGYHGLAYDSARSVTVLFGGYVEATLANGPAGDTWVWVGSAWTWTRVADTGPSARYAISMAYDSARGRTVLFGGLDGANNLGDTWEWDGSTWTQVAATGPSARFFNAMAYDSVRGRTVLFGGWDDTSALGDTWEWDGYTWTEIPATGPCPSPRYDISMAYDSARGVTVLFGGVDLTNNLGDTWEWDGSTWTQVPTTGPSARQTSLTYDSARGVTGLFGGWDGVRSLGDTWEFTGVRHNRPPVLEPIPDQAAFEGTLLQFTIKASDPDGDTIRYSADGLPPGASLDSASGNFLWTPGLGQAGTSYMVTFHASDGALTTDFGVRITVQGPPPGHLADVIVQNINNLKLPKEIRNSLVANAKKVGIFIEGGRVIAAINQLDALIDKVQREVARGTMTEADVRDLIEAATYLRDTLRGS